MKIRLIQRRQLLQSIAGALLLGVATSAVAATTEIAAVSPAPTAMSSPVAIDPDQLLSSQVRLGSNLIRRLARVKHATSNFVVSPASLAMVLALLDLGASRDMHAAIHHTLGFKAQSPQKAAAALMAVRSAAASIIRKGDGSSALILANLVVLDPASRPYPIALLGLAAAGADVSVEDLSKHETINRINEWVKNRTKGLIPAVLDEAPDDAGLVAINALYFKDRWRVPFDPKETSLDQFHTIHGRKIDVPMMHLPGGEYAFRQNDQFVGIELPYATDGFKLVVITTKTRTARAIDFNVISNWLTGQDFSQQRGELAIPRLSLSGTVELLDSLDAFGLRRARTARNALAGLSPTSQTISRILQKTELHINEEGTEAAAATAVTTLREMSPKGYIKMVIDKPFVFALRDQRTGLILLAGYVGEPNPIEPKRKRSEIRQ